MPQYAQFIYTAAFLPRNNGQLQDLHTEQQDAFGGILCLSQEMINISKHRLQTNNKAKNNKTAADFHLEFGALILQGSGCLSDNIVLYQYLQW